MLTSLARLIAERLSLKMATSDARKKVVEKVLQKKMYSRRKRAKAVGVEPLKNRRPTPAQRKDWEAKIVKAESQS